MTIRELIWRLNDPRDERIGRYVGGVLLFLETILCSVVIFRVPYTKIDWDAYMQQGERDYVELVGETGPCVYPAGFVYVFWFLQWATNGGDIFNAQIVFMGVYLMTQAVVFEMHIRSQQMPPWTMCLFCLSKRMHSIYLLRLFNDCLAMMVAYLALFCLTRSSPAMSVTLFSFAVSIKMNVLLMAPSVLIALLQGSTISVVVRSVAVGVALQVALAFPFLLHAPYSYIIRAFDLSRIFLYEWTVNLRFLPESVFVSRSLAVGLLLLHLGLLALFAEMWCSVDGGVFHTTKRFFYRKDSELTRFRTDRVLFFVFSGNLIGILCARSLHYQFYSWYFHSLPFLLWYAQRIPVSIKLLILFTIEICWNVFPSSPLSSITLLSMHILLLVFLACTERHPKERAE